jgi:hypothetical protein
LRYRDFADKIAFAIAKEDTMARRKRDDDQSSVMVKKGRTLPEPFPSCPTRNPTHCIYAKFPADAPNGEARTIAVPFSALYAAHRFVELLLRSESYEWQPANKALGYTDPDTIITEGNLSIRCHGLKEVLEHELSEAEREWEMPEALARQTLLVRRPFQTEETTNEDGEPVVRVKREPKEAKPKVDRTGLTTVGEIAQQMGIEPRDARTALRKQKIEKPETGWAWDPDQVEAIKATIKAGLK